MLTFKEFNSIIEEDSELAEALTMQQRLKARRQFKRIKHKVKIGRERAKRKTASKETLEKRARKGARKQLMRKLAKGEDPSKMSFAQKQRLEKKLEKLGPRIKMMTRKMIPQKRKEERLRKARQQMTGHTSTKKV